MKMILAVVQDIDADAATQVITDGGYRITRIASTGGFFRQGNTTLLCAVEDNQVEGVVKLLRETCKERTRPMPVTLDPGEAVLSAGAYTEVKIGGATVLVFQVERFENI
jgi:uncharacterized protein YaaQ